MNKRFGLLLLFSLLFTGCQTLPPGGSSLLSNSTPAPLTLEPCTVADGTLRAECGVLHVPEDRSHPARRSLDLDIVLVRARDSNPEPDPLFYLAGGPGDFATSPSNVVTANSIFWDIHEQRDIVFLDQRGSNGTHRLSCAWPSFPIIDATQQQVNNWMKDCLVSLDGDPHFYTTAMAMRDLDDARAALGYDKINLYGVSYGVTAAQVYMRMFPGHVRTAVLDHGTALDLPFFQAMPRASQSALDQIFTYCEQDEKCHTAYPDVRREWKQVLDRLAKGPVITSFIPPGADSPAQMDLDALKRAVHSGMMDVGAYAIFPSVIHALATNEDWSDILRGLSEQPTGSDPVEDRFLLMASIIQCFEPAWGNDPLAIAWLNSDSYYRDEMLEDARLDRKICAALPKPASSLIYGRGKPVPLSALMFNGLLDPQNPPSNMDLALKEFTKSRMLVEPTGSHGNTSTDFCKWELITQYIEQGSVDGLDTSCMDDQKSSFVIGD